ncbi:uncharacterized protein LOC132042938 [Lycium ferocissimum]|uniref:uncharacterized protein LOC132042938 n=1 Tax=Lycium ferocissimum TaxID=112874 RepID=UPI002815AA95|nr:uncharacterized protein LOC132042938 [Lycium ferocissimum]
MELISDIVQEFSASAHTPREIKLLQQLLPDLARQDRMVQNKWKSYSAAGNFIEKNDEIVHINKCRYIYARLKRKIALIRKKYKDQPLKRIDLVLNLVVRCTQLMNLTNSTSREMLIPLNDGYRLGILLEDIINKTYIRQKLSMRQFYGFRIQQRLNEGYTLLQARRLLQKYIVDGYLAIEEERFHYIKNDQKKLRSNLASRLMDVVVQGDSDCSMVGKLSYWLLRTLGDLDIGHKIIKMQ